MQFGLVILWFSTSRFSEQTQGGKTHYGVQGGLFVTPLLSHLAAHSSLENQDEVLLISLPVGRGPIPVTSALTGSK